MPINDLAAEALEKYLAERDLIPVDCDEVFLSNQLQPLTVRSVQSIIAAAGKAAGIERPVTPHLLRHTTVTMVQELGAGIQTAQSLVGHASVVTTERYTHLNKKFVREAFGTLSDALKQRTAELQAAAPASPKGKSLKAASNCYRAKQRVSRVTRVALADERCHLAVSRLSQR